MAKFALEAMHKNFNKIRRGLANRHNTTVYTSANFLP